MTARNFALALLAATACVPVPAAAQTAAADDKVDRLIALLVQQGIITADKAQALREASAPGAGGRPMASAADGAATNSSAAPAASGSAAPAGNSTMAAIDNQSAMRQPETARPPAAKAAQEASWTDRLRIDGDIRLRWQAEYFDKKTSAAIPNWAALSTSGTILPVTNFLSSVDRARLRYRARLGITGRINDHFTAVVRLAAGNLTEPTSTDQTLGDFLNRDGVGIDRAYLQWQPAKAITVTGGRMPNPFYTTNLMFDGDVNPEGVAATFRHDLKAGYIFATGSAWYIQENANRTPDRFTYAAQIGVAGLPLGPKTHLRLAASYYDWAHYRGVPGNTATASTVLGQGNTLLDIDPRATNVLPGIASKFRIAEALGAVSQRLDRRYAISAAFDVAVNVAYDRDALLRLPLLTQPNGSLAWLGALTVGDPNVAERGQWQITGSYRKLQSDSVVAAFTEGDYNPGGTNREVQTIEGLIGVDHNAWLQVSYFHNRFLSGPRYEYDAVRTQLNVKF